MANPRGYVYSARKLDRPIYEDISVEWEFLVTNPGWVYLEQEADDALAAEQASTESGLKSKDVSSSGHSISKTFREGSTLSSECIFQAMELYKAGDEGGATVRQTKADFGGMTP